jgi:hypothetical protein
VLLGIRYRREWQRRRPVLGECHINKVPVAAAEVISLKPTFWNEVAPSGLFGLLGSSSLGQIGVVSMHYSFEVIMPDNILRSMAGGGSIV